MTTPLNSLRAFGEQCFGLTLSSYLVCFLLLVSIAGKSGQEICASPTCNQGGYDAVDMDLAVLTSPCVAPDLSCYAYNLDGACPFSNLVDCSKVATGTKSPPSMTTSAPSTPSTTFEPTATSTTEPPTNSDKAQEGMGHSTLYIIGAAAAVILIGAVVFLAVRHIRKTAKSSHANGMQNRVVSPSHGARGSLTLTSPSVA
ncbi:hypothetical protein Ae201684P_020107 [Aphanomyces euteiches]|uniref:Uncharacterized protein n=1 Tax=Aphanomyces euteiches TaxID=100861 RepID=A0A6G0XSN5_9STRA|nr:hypothetical protein Ae201684_001771 [Aphanomyces euteiches]KAH9071848.1 hypothetical protein Ae201684P_020107 [Aphanomyces euteiches]